MDISDYNDPFGESIESKGKYYPMVVLTNKKLLNDETYTDLVIKVGSETVHAHAAIVSSRCEEIISFHQDEKSKRVKKKHEVKIKDSVLASGAVMQNVLEYLYTGVVDFPKLSDKDILFLVKGARFFKLDRLSYLCERWLNEHMTIESVFHLLKAATDLNEERIKGFCLHFALQNYNSFISNKDGIYILGIELFQEVVAAFQTNPAPPVAITPENAPPDTLLSDFKRLYGEMSYSDFSVTIGAETIRCHKAILAAHSDVFVSQVFKEAEPNLGISAEAFKTCLRFLYYGEDNVEPLPACELVGFTRKYKLPSLLRICEDKIRTSVAPNTVMQILSVSYLAAEGKQDLNEELRSKCIPFILQNLSKVDLKVIRTCNPLMTVDLLLELQNACKRGDYGLRDFTVSGGSGGHSGHSGHSSRSESSRDVKAPSKAPAHPPPTDFPPPPLSEAGLLGAQRNGRPAPPPRGSKDPIVKESSNASPGLPPPVIGAPAPPSREKSIPSPPAPAAAESSEDDHSSKGRLTRKKSQKDVASELKKVPSAVDATKKGTANKKDKKEEDKRKKDELKRIAKEKKERQKMEKKFKGGKGGEIF